MEQKRIIALDYGDSRIGVAVSDALMITAQGVGIIDNRGFETVASKVKEYIASLGATLVVVGNPINMDGSRGPRSEKTVDFAEKLEKTIDIPVVLFDERLSTKQAERSLEMMGVNWKKQKNMVDIIASQIILESYMDFIKNKKQNER